MPQHTNDIYDFDRIVDRRSSDSVKWRQYGDVLPLWVADMDFPAPPPVIEALRQRVEHGIFGYPYEPPALRPALVEWLRRRFAWEVAPDALVYVPGVVGGFNIACRATCAPGQGVLVQTPVYPPMLDAAANHGLIRDEMLLTQGADGHYEIDFAAFEAAIAPHTRLFMLCNPQNPTGRAFTVAELTRLAEICLRHDLLICSDEIHGDLVFAGQRHTPIATLGPEIAARTITLMAPSKTFNIPGLGFSLAIIEDSGLRAAFKAAQKDIVPHVNVLGYTGALAAYTEGEPWLEACLRYLEANRDILVSYVADHLPRMRMTTPEATYLAWLDCRATGLGEQPGQFFLERVGVALNEGNMFGRGGAGFVRLNFGCPRATLLEALDRMAAALDDLPRHTKTHEAP